MDIFPINQQLFHQYQGFLDAADLGGIAPLASFKAFILEQQQLLTNEQVQEWVDEIPSKLVLGKRVEHFMSYYLKQHPRFTIITQNIQIFEEKRTIGELDFLIQDLEQNQVIHLEQVYKFYLYIPKADPTEINCWIGPNYKDSLQQKIHKLQQKQFPLLYQKTTQKALAPFNLTIKAVQQQLSFKAALFVPLGFDHQQLSSITAPNIEGFWLRFDLFEEKQYGSDLFYLPQKQNWGVAPAVNTIWHSYHDAKIEIQQFLQNKRAPLCWRKTADNQYTKFFVVWW